MKSWPVVLLLLATPAAADTIGAEPQDYGRVTAVTKGVKELDLGGIFVLTHASVDGASNTSISTLGNAAFQYYFSDNVSAGAAILTSYDRQSSTTYSTGFGGMVFASYHFRLGLGAFLRPTVGAGFLAGSQKSEITPGTLASASDIAAITRLSLPFAFFASRRIVLQAGPELDVSFGRVTPDGADRTSYTKVTGGFGVSAGYTF